MLLSAAFIRSFSRERPQASEFVFFLLGAGFMLLETKAITELGLHLGNTFFVISVVIAALLIKRTKNIGAAMGMNIFGAMCGGLIEYCAMFTGYRMLYVAAIAIYGLAFALTFLPLSKAQPALSKAE